MFHLNKPLKLSVKRTQALRLHDLSGKAPVLLYPRKHIAESHNVSTLGFASPLQIRHHLFQELGWIGVCALLAVGLLLPLRTGQAQETNFYTSVISLCEKNLTVQSVLDTPDKWTSIVKKKASQKTSNQPYCKIALGYLYLLQQKYFFAVHELSAGIRLLEASSKNKGVLWKAKLFLSHALLLTGQNEAAAKTALRVRCKYKECTAFKSYVLGVAGFRSGNDNTALQAFGQPELNTLPQRYLDSARVFQSLAYLRASLPAASNWAWLRTGLEYDTNPLFLPDDNVMITPHRREEAARNFLTISSTMNLYQRGRTSLDANLLIHRSFHSGRASQYNSTIVALRPIMRLFLSASASYALDLAYSFQLLGLDGGDLTPEKNFFLYLESHSLLAGVQIFRLGNLSIFPGLLAGYERYAQIARNTLFSSLLLTSRWQVSDSVNLQLTCSLARREAHNKGWSRDTYTTQLHAQFEPAIKFGFSFTTGLRYSHYPYSAEYFSQHQLRNDTDADITGQIYYRMTEHWRIEAYGSWNVRNSTVNSYSFDKFVAGLALSWLKQN